MFLNCTSLIQAPELPATELKDKCYYSMFLGCSNLRFAPSELPATELGYLSYCGMLQDCDNLVNCPKFPPNITLAMFLKYTKNSE